FGSSDPQNNQYSDSGTNITVDSAGNIYVTGYFTGTADFDPGPGVYNITSAGLPDAFVAKYTAAGRFVWARPFGGGGASGRCLGMAIAVDGSGNVYTTGDFCGTVDFDPGSGTLNIESVDNNTDAFVVKLDVLGNLVWAKTLGGVNQFSNRYGDRGEG